MRYTRTQVYLEPDDHRRLVEEAKKRGVSLAALIRDIVSTFNADRYPPRRRGVEALIGIAHGGEPTNIASDEEDYRAEALERRLRKKLGLEPDASDGARPD